MRNEKVFVYIHFLEPKLMTIARGARTQMPLRMPVTHLRLRRGYKEGYMRVEESTMGTGLQDT